ncbi:MAG: PEGA domain-containing protein [Methanoregula sp.]|jgi:hypothetical protein
MSRRSGSSVIPVAVFLVILLIVLPVSADNITTNETIVVPPNATVTTTATAVATTLTAVGTTQTAAPTTQVTIATTQATATPGLTTIVVTQPTMVGTTAYPAVTTGSVSVYSSPIGASILIDGFYSGTTPKTVNGVPAGNHILRLTLSGYNDYEGSIYIVAGQTAQGYGTLQPISQIGPAAPTQTVIVPVVVPVVTAAPVPTEDPGLLGNSGVMVAIIGVITAIIAAGASVFTHVKPPKKE